MAVTEYLYHQVEDEPSEVVTEVTTKATAIKRLARQFPDMPLSELWRHVEQLKPGDRVWFGSTLIVALTGSMKTAGL